MQNTPPLLLPLRSMTHSHTHTHTTEYTHEKVGRACLCKNFPVVLYLEKATQKTEKLQAALYLKEVMQIGYVLISDGFFVSPSLSYASHSMDQSASGEELQAALRMD